MGKKNKVSREVTASDINCLENLVVAYNTVFLMSSVFVITIASTVRELFTDFIRVLSPSLLLFIIAGFIVFLAALGYVAIGKKSSSLMSMYAMLLIFIFVMEISAGLGILSFRREIRPMVSAKMKKALNAYNEDQMTANLVDYAQLQLQCCGVNGFRDWDDVLNPRYQTDCKIGDFSLPRSCCTQLNSTSPIVNRSGCLAAVNKIFHRNALALTTAIIAICTIQAFGAYFAYSLATSLSKFKKQQAIQSENSMPAHELGIPISYNEKNNYF